MKSLRFWFDTIMRTGIKMTMLTGVAFAVTACYGPVNRPEDYNDPEFQTDTQQLEQQLVIEPEELAE